MTVPSPFADLSRKTKEAQIETSVGRAVIWSAPTKTDERCSWLQLGGHNVEVDPCFPPVYLAGGLRLRYVRVAGAKLLFGRVQARDSREGGIRVTFEDGSSTVVRPSTGFLLYEVRKPGGALMVPMPGQPRGTVRLQLQEAG